jgi:hypothetical protein
MTTDHGQENARGWLGSIEEMLKKLNTLREEEMRDDEARDEIEQSVLSVLVRDGWRTPGSPSEDGAEEYEILLSTGGPALRIWGTLDACGEPHSAELQHQDWGTPWTRYPAPEATLLQFARCFYFG